MSDTFSIKIEIMDSPPMKQEVPQHQELVSSSLRINIDGPRIKEETFSEQDFQQIKSELNEITESEILVKNEPEEGNIECAFVFGTPSMSNKHLETETSSGTFTKDVKADDHSKISQIDENFVNIKIEPGIPHQMNSTNSDNKNRYGLNFLNIKTVKEDLEFSVKGTGSKKTYTCSECQYQTVHKTRIKIHCLIHKDKSEIKMFRCEVCPYETIYKAALQRHILLKHVDPAKIKMFRCKVCKYKTKIKTNLTKHELIHKSEQDVEVFSCTSCDYKTKFKQHMTTHLLVHKKSEEVLMFRCKFCDYKTKFKASLRTHLKTHDQSGQGETFRCHYESCNFESKQKANYKKHLLLHQDKLNRIQLICPICEFSTYIKYKFKRHLKTHEIPVDKRLNCGYCDYQTRFESHLEKHIKRTHDKSKIFHCEICLFKTKCKTYLKKHILSVHENPESMKTYSCQLCNYVTGFSSNLTRHCKVNHSTICEIFDERDLLQMPKIIK